MNYRHAFHAGNFADVLKHATLALVIEHLKGKPARFRVVDTHAGRGRYDLRGIEACKTGEWAAGIGRLLDQPLPPEVEPLLAPYLGAVAALNPTPLSADTIVAYPGSPLVARHLLRPGDKLVVNELHEQDHAALQRLLGADRQCKVTALDGWTALKALLPPPERRGVILVDPPFEQPGEFDRLAAGLDEVARRFATGIVLLWYPIKNLAAVTEFRRVLARSRLKNLLDVELMVQASDARGLPGCGLAIANPPFGADAKLLTLTAFLAERLAGGPGAQSSLRWLSTPAPS